MTDDGRHREELCPACLAFPGEHDQRVIVGRPDGTTLQTWHKDDCPLIWKPSGPDEEPTT
ncbi:hypothetical protein TR631_33810 [Streptomyces rochei]|uniref:hypothetical protein n=1 Tax=Streptomyces rochei TaxID=1928 RepID=UPI002ACF02DD|nr:hypothetical protein [Streptomyces rochei]WQC16540.1 hypothetical protein TR631_33810 [Streptomyces rochei]